MSITTQQTVAAPSGTFRADPVNSSVTFEVGYMGVGVFSGAVKDFEATLVDGRLAGAARMASLDPDDENLKAHLLSPEFFDAERHPEVSFSTDAVERNGDDIVFEGELTIKGVTRPAKLTGAIVGPVTDPSGNERFGIEIERTIDRTEFGITCNKPPANGGHALDEKVTLTPVLSLVKAV